jgi:hypothetical protein
MQCQSHEIVALPGSQRHPPIVLKPRQHRNSKVLGLSLLTGLSALVIAPQIGLAGYALTSTEFRASLVEHPFLALEFAIVLAFWVGLVCWPLASLITASSSMRTVKLGHGEVKIIDETPFSTSTQRLPLSEFEGIAVNPRSRLPGSRQEAILVHPARRKSIVLMVAEHIGDPEVRELCRILGLPRLPAGLYRRSGLPGWFGAASAKPVWRAGQPASF